MSDSERPMSCRAVARVIGVRIGYEPHRHTVRRWALQWCERDVDYLLVPKRMLVRQAAIEKIMAQLSKLEQL